MKFSDERELFAAASMFRDPPPVDRRVLRDYWRPIPENRWLILAVTLLALLGGGVAALVMRPVYEANLLIQIADAASPTPKNALGDAATSFDIKTPAAAEIELLRSRMVVAPAAEKYQLSIVAQPRYLKLPESWYGDPDDAAGAGWFSLARLARWVQGAQAITVAQFDVPAAWEGRKFILTVGDGGSYTLQHPSLHSPLQGRVGELLDTNVGNGRLSLLVTGLEGTTGSEFSLVRKSRGKAMEDLQDSLKVGERGRQSSVIEATLRDSDPVRAADVLNTIGANYVRQDVERKWAEAEKSIAFLGSQLPLLKQQMERAESAYNSFRSSKGAVSLDTEARIALERSFDVRGRLGEARQRQQEMLAQLGPEHPSMKVMNQQIASLESQLRAMQGRISAMPATQQDALQYERDVKLTTDLYQQTRNNLFQLQLVRQGLTGNARIVDAAIPPEKQVRPPALVVGVSAVAGLVLSVLLAFVRSALARGVRSAHEIETHTGLNVYPTAIGVGKAQRLANHRPQHALTDKTAVGLRQLCTVVQHQMRGRGNNRLMIAGPTEGVGVQFIAAKLGALLAAGGNRVLLIDTDLRGGSLHGHFGVDSGPGLAELIAGTCTAEGATRPTGIPGLDLVPAGTEPVDLDENESSARIASIMEHASKKYDVVLLSGPPVLHSAETLTIASSAGMVVLVAQAHKTAVEDIGECARRLSLAGQIPSGVVLNGL